MPEFTLPSGNSYVYMDFDPNIYGTKRSSDNGGTIFREFRLNSPTYSASLNSMRGTRSYYSPYEFMMENNRVFRDFLGGTGIGLFSGMSKLFYARTIPHRLQGTRAFADAVNNLKGNRGGPSPERDTTLQDGIGKFDECDYTVSYSNREYNVLSDEEIVDTGNALFFIDDASGVRYFSIQQTPVSKWQTMPPLTGGVLFWEGSNATPAAIKAQVPLSEYDLVVTQHELPAWAVNFAYIDSCIGKTNADAVFTEGQPPIFRTYPPGSLLMGAPAFRYYPHWSGQIYIDVSFRFRFVPYGETPKHTNTFYRWDAKADANPFQAIVRGKDQALTITDNNGIIRFAEFSPCFSPHDFALEYSQLLGDTWFNILL